MVCLQFRDMNIGNVLPVILNGIRVDYTVQSKGQEFQEENT
jgi:Fe-S cluster assembly iron-binding protein IscA